MRAILARADITKLLSDTLVSYKLLGKYWADEVTINLGTPEECRVDFLEFKPCNQSTAGIERGVFTGYEIKSCVADFRSKNGHNLFFDKNYYVMTMETYKAVGKELSYNQGAYVLVPMLANPLDEFESPAELSLDTDWTLHCIKPCHKYQWRQHSTASLLFMMFRSGATRLIGE